MDKITLEEFKKLDLRVAKIEEASPLENSDKLLLLKIDLGSEKKQIVAGIGKFYKAEDLLNKQIIVLANLETKKIRGFESQGMLLAASSENGEVVLIVPQKNISPGSKIS
jgi:methionine--tRNA ligase beta chain